MNSRSRDDEGKLDEWHEETGLASVIVGAPPQLRLALLVLTGRDTNTVLRSLISVPDTRVTPNVLRYTQLKGLAGQPLMSMFWWSPPKPSLTLPPTQFICSAAQPTWFHLWCWWPLWILRQQLQHSQTWFLAVACGMLTRSWSHYKPSPCNRALEAPWQQAQKTVWSYTVRVVWLENKWCKVMKFCTMTDVTLLRTYICNFIHRCNFNAYIHLFVFNVTLQCAAGF